MFGSYRAELMRIRKRPAAWSLLAIWLFLSVLFSYIIPYVSYLTSGGTALLKSGSTSASVLDTAMPDQLVVNAVSGWPLFGGGVALIFGALLVGSEYNWDTIKTLFTQGPSRTRIAASKGVALATATLGAVIAAFALGAVAGGVIALRQGRALDWPAFGDLLVGVAVAWAVAMVWALLGATLAVLTRGVAFSIGIGLVWLFLVEGLLSGVASTMLPGLQPVRDAFPGTAAGALVGAITTSVRAGGATPGVNTAIDGAQAGITLGVYLVVMAVGSWLVLRRRDVT